MLTPVRESAAYLSLVLLSPFEGYLALRELLFL